MNLGEFESYLRKKGFYLRYKDLNGALKIYAGRSAEGPFNPCREYTTIIYSSEMQTRTQKEYEQLVMDRVNRLINEKFTEPVDTTMEVLEEEKV